MDVIMSKNLSYEDILLAKYLLNKKHKVKLFLYGKTNRSHEIFASSTLPLENCIYYLDALRYETVVEEKGVFTGPKEYTTRKLSNQLTEYYDKKQILRIKIQFFSGKLDKADYYAENGDLESVEHYDSRGFLDSKEDLKRQLIETYNFDGQLLFSESLKPAKYKYTVRIENESEFQTNHLIFNILQKLFRSKDKIIFRIKQNIDDIDEIEQNFKVVNGIEENNKYKKARDYINLNRIVGKKNTEKMIKYSELSNESISEATKTFQSLRGSQETDFLKNNLGASGNIVFFGRPLKVYDFANIYLGERFFCNVNSLFAGQGKIQIGDNAKIGPDVKFLTESVPLNPVLRNNGYRKVENIMIGHNVWIGGKVTIRGGVTIGNNVVVAAGAVVNQSFGDNVIIAGVPARVVKTIDLNKLDF